MSQHTYKPLKPLISSDGMVYPSLPGTTLADFGRLAAPTVPEIRDMLKELRAQPGWSLGLTHAVLGVPIISVRHWELPCYRPGSPARKLIWLLHQTLILGKTHNPLSIATWGKLDGIPLARLERLIRRTTPRAIAEPERAQGEAGRRRQGKRPPVSRGGGGVTRGEGDPHMRNSEQTSDVGDMRNSTENLDSAKAGEVSDGSGFTGKVSEDKVRLADPRKVQVVLGHGRIYRRVKRRTERARKKELGKAYKKVKYEVPEGVPDGDDSWKWG